MKTLLRNKTQIYYAMYDREAPLLDGNGLDTGESIASFSEPVALYAHVSANKGEAYVDPFGVDLDYTKTIVVDDVSCPITETSRLWIDVPSSSPYNYAVVRVAKSLNHITYAVKEVAVS